MTAPHDVPDELWSLTDALIHGTIEADGLARLESALAADPQLQDFFVEYWELHADICVAEAAGRASATATLARSDVSGRALAPGETPTRSVSEESIPHAPREADLTPARRASEGVSAPPTRSVSEESTPHAPREADHHAERDEYYPRRLLLSLATAAAVLLAVGTLVFTLWPRQPAQPVVEAPAIDPAAKIVGLTDAQWLGTARMQGHALAPGERLVLERGSAEIVFNSQARVIVQGPADFTIDNAAACRLTYGKLTAQVPDPAKGFQVHTPSGTVTDLGTEFGVHVRDQAGGDRLEAVGEEEREQPATGGPQFDGTQPSVTEVHVFKGKVDVAQADQLVQTPPQTTTSPPSPLAPRPSTILSAGQAITISQNKVQPLPATDPFKFAIDKLQGKPRHVLLTEDFEAYDLARQVKSFGPWIVQSGTRKGQGVSVEDPAQMIAAANAEVDISVRLPPPPSLVGSRVANFGTSPQNSTDTYPVLCREIDGKLLAKKCQVLVEFDFFPRSDEPQLSLALATEVGHTTGIELWRSIDAAKQSVDAAKQGVDAAKKVDLVSYRWYRMRVLVSVADGVVSEVRVDRSQWRGPEGWVRDLSYRPPTPKLDWSTPPRYAIFGFPVVSPATVGGVFWLDNVRIEVIAEK